MEGTTQLIRFLGEELGISETAISLALRHCEQTPNYLPIVLWQYGLVTMDQLSEIFDWLYQFQ